MNPIAGGGSTPWQIVHVDNSAAAGGDGTYENPYNTLAEAQADTLNVNNEWTITYVNEGTSTSLSGTTYGGTFQFQQDYQSLVGSGGDFVIESQANCGTNIAGSGWLYTIPQQTTNNPVLNPSGPSVDTNGQAGTTTANLTITGSQTGFLASGNMTGAVARRPGTTANPLGLTTTGATAVRNVTIAGDGTTNPQRGVWLSNTTGSRGSSGDIEFTDTVVGNMNNTGFRVDGGNETKCQHQLFWQPNQ